MLKTYGRRKTLLLHLNDGVLFQFNHHAFRYAEVRGLTRAPRREDFRALAIPRRINERQQRRMMPRRYWKHLTEME